MTVTCPNCSTSFNLPESHNKENAKLRCSVCKHVFPLVKGPAINLNLNMDFGKKANKKEKDTKKKKWPMVLLLLLCVLGGLGYAFREHLPQNVRALIDKEAANQELSQEELIKSIVLRDVRHYNFNNEKVGALSAIEGKVVNGFSNPRELIRIEVSLYDKDGQALVSKQQLAGTTVSLFQLQVLSETELEKALSNQIDILTNNTNVLPGGEVPFTLVFYNPPDTAVEFGVKVVDAKIPPNAQ